jgi:CheY-like chemotaxis protein
MASTRCYWENMDAKILLVDDAHELVDAYVAFLHATTPHEVRAASSGGAALQILRTWRPDIVVTDISMPDMDGLELITRMRSELAPPLPVIVAMSGFPDFEREARRRGAQVFQVKPIDTDDLVALIESLLTNREPPDLARTHTQARRQAASERARVAVSTTLTRRPHYPEVAHLGMRLLSRYFDDADTAILLMGERQPQIFASSGWSAGAQPDGVLGYALDVVVSGSTLIVPDLAAMPSSAARAPARDWRLFAAVPVRSTEGLAIGALALADRRLLPFDVHDLAILEHIARRLGAVFSGTEGPGMLQGPGVLVADSWRHCLGCEVEHIATGQSLVIALASIQGDDAMIPGSSPQQMDDLERAIGKLVERLPPRTALGRLTRDTLAAYSLVQEPQVGEQALLSLMAALEEEPRRACAGILSATGLCPTDGGAALLDIAHWLLDAAMTRGPATTLCARLAPAAIDHRLAS